VTDSSAATNTETSPELQLAAIDLGSNSFQLLIANFSHGQLNVVDRLREMVRLAAGLDEQQNLTEESQQRALECLARFGERLRDIPADRLRVVGTNTLRRARNPEAFIQQAQQLLGHQLDIISGIEEARLIYSGVSRTLPEVEGGQLIVDIGGGSTEIAFGSGYQPQKLESLFMGCVGISQTFFAGGKISAKRFRKARTAVQLELRPVAEKFRRNTWVRAAGASGTIRAAAAVLTEMKLMEQNITVDALESLIEELIAQGHVKDLALSGLAEQRAAVFPGGVAILAELMKSLRITELVVSQGALREGILFDLLGRLGDEDSRVRTVRAMESRYHVDQDQADRVELTATTLLNQVAADWKLTDVDTAQLLRWAARLHELGLDIAHTHYHRHGAYLLQHTEMPGFHRNEQIILARLVASHRRKLNVNSITNAVPDGWAKRTTKLAILLRLAALFNRSRTNEFPDAMKIVVDKRFIKLSLTKTWLEQNPLTMADLEREQKYLAECEYQLELISLD
jgi:exopolyphosphatase/guanosine-5'-triphosphate,3'-diphosphate pyrophosphatase